MDLLSCSLGLKKRLTTIQLFELVLNIIHIYIYIFLFLLISNLITSFQLNHFYLNAKIPKYVKGSDLIQTQARTYPIESINSHPISSLDRDSSSVPRAVPQRSPVEGRTTIDGTKTLVSVQDYTGRPPPLSACTIISNPLPLSKSESIWSNPFFSEPSKCFSALAFPPALFLSKLSPSPPPPFLLPLLIPKLL